MMDSLPQELLTDGSPFDIASSMLQTDVTFAPVAQPVLSNISSPTYRPSLDFVVDAKFEEALFQTVNVDTGAISSVPSMTTNIEPRTAHSRRRKGQPQKLTLIYCDLDSCDDNNIALSVVTDDGDMQVATVPNLTNSSELCINVSTDALDKQMAKSVDIDSQLKAADEEFRCETCNVVLHSKSKWKSHVRTHRAKKDLKCNVCGTMAALRLLTIS